MFSYEDSKGTTKYKQIAMNTGPLEECMEPSPFSFVSWELSLQPLSELS